MWGESRVGFVLIPLQAGPWQTHWTRRELVKFGTHMWAVGSAQVILHDWGMPERVRPPGRE